MDTAQRAVRIAIAAYAQATARLTGDGITHGAGDAVRSRFAPLDAEADRASADYLAVLDGLPDLTLPDLDRVPDHMGYLEQHLRSITKKLHELSLQLEGFLASHAAEFRKADAAVAYAAERVQEVGQALAAARSAVASLGAGAGDVSSALDAAEQAAAALTGGPVALGVTETVRRAEVALQAAVDARYAATSAAERETALRRRLSSLRTRSEAAAYRASRLEPELSRLRRGHVASSWADVEAGLTAVRPLLTSVPERLRNAEGLLEAGERVRAADLVQAVVSDLRRLDAAVDAVGERRQLLDALAADPHAAVERTRFALRDAQRLALARPDPEQSGWVTRLDRLVELLAQAQQSLDEGRSRRDWWAFAQALQVVERAVKDLVDDVRRTRAGTVAR